VSEKRRFSNKQKRSTFALSGLENPCEKFFTFVGYVRVSTTDQNLISAGRAQGRRVEGRVLPYQGVSGRIFKCHGLDAVLAR
jgi:hypothetical protein